MGNKVQLYCVKCHMDFQFPAKDFTFAMLMVGCGWSIVCLFVRSSSMLHCHCNFISWRNLV